MFFLPYLYMLLVIVLQTLALFTPVFSEVFRGPGFSAAIFTISLITSHWAILWPRLKSWHTLAVIPLLAVTEFAVLTFAMISGGESLLTNPHHPLGFLAETGYEGITTSLLIQTPLSLVVSIGLWMGIKDSQFVVRKAGLDQEEQWNLFTYRMNRLNDDENTFYKYRNLLNRGISMVGSQKRKIYGVISSLRMGDTLYLYDLYLSPDTDRVDLERELIEGLVNRGEILTTSINRVVLTVPDTEDWLARKAPSMGFSEVTDKTEKEQMYEQLDSILKDRYSRYHPFQRIKQYFVYPLPDKNEIQNTTEIKN